MGLSAGQGLAWPLQRKLCPEGRTCLEIPAFPPPLGGFPGGQERKGTSEEPGDKASSTLGEGRKETEAGHQEELSGAPEAVGLGQGVRVGG